MNTDDCVLPPPLDETAPLGPTIAGNGITLVVESCGESRVLKIAGELDIVSGAMVTGRCIEGQPRDVVVDLADLTFLDCGGYRAFVAARATLEQHHRTLTLVGAVGEPRRLLDLIQQIDLTGPSC